MNKLTKEELMKLYNEGKNLSGKPIFISFYATWWGPCKMFEQVLNEVTSEYQDRIQMYKVNIEELGYENIIEAENEDEAEIEAFVDCKMNLHEYVTATTEEIK